MVAQSHVRLAALTSEGERAKAGQRERAQVLTRAQRSWLARGLDEPGGKLPLFDENGGRIHPRTVRRCIEAGWAEPWFANPIKPDWLICRLTAAGRRALAGGGTAAARRGPPLRPRAVTQTARRP